MSKERNMIFSLFAVGLAGNLGAVLSTCFILMDFPVSLLAVAIVIYAAWIIVSNSIRIQKKFFLAEAVRLDDLTQYSSSLWNNSNTVVDKGDTISLLGPRKKSPNEIV
jgi:hypothetical protein